MIMKVLLLCDDISHPGHVPSEGIVPLKEYGFQFDIITDAKNFNPEILSGYDAVLISKSDNTSREDKTDCKTESVQQAFIGYVENGGGLLAVHSGVVAGEHTEALNRLIGCRFIFHPRACPVTVQPVKPHPVTEGVEMFCETDEHYRIEILANDIDILMASYSPPPIPEPGHEPNLKDTAWISAACYVRTQGKGRICVLTPGHFLPIWHTPQFQRTLKNALNWCAGKNK